MDQRQARSDERDNSRVFAWGAGAAIVVFLGALGYYFVVDRRAEGPATAPSTQPAPVPRP